MPRLRRPLRLIPFRLLAAVAGLAVVAAGGCEAVRWEKPGADDAATEQDFRDCRQISRLAAQRALTLDPQFLARRSAYPPVCHRPYRRHQDDFRYACPAVDPWGTALPRDSLVTNRSMLQAEYMDRCLRARGYRLMPVDDGETR
jgi:hypothetical protein